MRERDSHSLPYLRDPMVVAATGLDMSREICTNGSSGKARRGHAGFLEACDWKLRYYLTSLTSLTPPPADLNY